MGDIIKQTASDYFGMIFAPKKQNALTCQNKFKTLLILLFNTLLHSIFAFEVYLQNSYPFFKLVEIPNRYYYAVQAVIIIPLTLQVLLIFSGVIYFAMFTKSNKISYFCIFDISVHTVSVSIAVFSAIPCIVLYLIFSYKMAVFVPFLCAAALIIAFISVSRNLHIYCRSSYARIIPAVAIAFIISYSLEVLLVR